MIIGRLSTAPWGTFAGLPVLDLEFARPLPRPERARDMCLAAVQQHRAIQTVWISAAPWADEEMASLLDHALRDFPSCYAAQDLAAPSWGYRDVHWFVDASRLFGDGASPAGIAHVVNGLPGFPTPAEVLVQCALEQNIVAPLLSQVAMSCGGPGTFCELQVRPDLLSAGLRAAAAAHGAWRVRSLVPGPVSIELFKE